MIPKLIFGPPAVSGRLARARVTQTYNFIDYEAWKSENDRQVRIAGPARHATTWPRGKGIVLKFTPEDFERPTKPEWPRGWTGYNGG